MSATDCCTSDCKRICGSVAGACVCRYEAAGKVFDFSDGQWRFIISASSYDWTVIGDAAGISSGETYTSADPFEKRTTDSLHRCQKIWTLLVYQKG